MHCYICLEDCNYKSPCQCKTPIHRGCLFHLHCRGFHHCPVCGNYLETSDYLLFIAFLLLRWFNFLSNAFKYLSSFLIF